MKVFYKFYELHPKRKANRLSSLETKQGIHLKGVLGDKVLFADYFPHSELGDKSCDEFLAQFKFQNQDYEKKVFSFLLNDHDLQKCIPKKFLNHELWDRINPPQTNIIKYKIKDQNDFDFIPLLERNKIIRLDANGLFNRTEFVEFSMKIPSNLLKNIEYIEDPLHDPNWSNLPIRCAKDFIDASDFDYYIYKPNCEFKPNTESKIIFSSYLGSELGTWHAYTELIALADLNLHHGIYTQGIYQEEVALFTGSYHSGFIVDKKEIIKMYQSLFNSEWKALCSM